MPKIIPNSASITTVWITFMRIHFNAILPICAFVRLHVSVITFYPVFISPLGQMTAIVLVSPACEWGISGLQSRWMKTALQYSRSTALFLRSVNLTLFTFSLKQQFRTMRTIAKKSNQYLHWGKKNLTKELVNSVLGLLALVVLISLSAQLVCTMAFLK